MMDLKQLQKVFVGTVGKANALLRKTSEELEQQFREKFENERDDDVRRRLKRLEQEENDVRRMTTRLQEEHDSLKSSIGDLKQQCVELKDTIEAGERKRQSLDEDISQKETKLQQITLNTAEVVHLEQERELPASDPQISDPGSEVRHARARSTSSAKQSTVRRHSNSSTNTARSASSLRSSTSTAPHVKPRSGSITGTGTAGQLKRRRVVSPPGSEQEWTQEGGFEFEVPDDWELVQLTRTTSRATGMECKLIQKPEMIADLLDGVVEMDQQEFEKPSSETINALERKAREITAGTRDYSGDSVKVHYGINFIELTERACNHCIRGHRMGGCVFTLGAGCSKFPFGWMRSSGLKR